MSQLLLEKSQSKDTKNLVDSIPVKEGEKLSPVQYSYFSKIRRTTSHGLHNIILDLEISIYGTLSRYEQSKRYRLSRLSLD